MLYGLRPPVRLDTCFDFRQVGTNWVFARKLLALILTLASIATFWAAFASKGPATATFAVSGVTLTPCHVDGVKEELRCGVYDVFENRRTRTGRKLPLKIVVISARHPHPDQGPVFYMSGGSGESATEMADLMISELCWLKPKLVTQVSFTEWTNCGLLRHATFEGLRDDKELRAIAREL